MQNFTTQPRVSPALLMFMREPPSGYVMVLGTFPLESLWESVYCGQVQSINKSIHELKLKAVAQYVGVL